MKSQKVFEFREFLIVPVSCFAQEKKKAIIFNFYSVVCFTYLSTKSVHIPHYQLTTIPT